MATSSDRMMNRRGLMTSAVAGFVSAAGPEGGGGTALSVLGEPAVFALMGDVMPRTEKPLDPLTGPVAAFAYDLRALRGKAGSPPYRTLARRAGYSATTLSVAASGSKLPSLDVTLAYVQACGGDPGLWRERWQTLAAQPVSQIRHEPVPPPAGERRALQPAAVAASGNSAPQLISVIQLPSRRHARAHPARRTIEHLSKGVTIGRLQCYLVREIYLVLASLNNLHKTTY